MMSEGKGVACIFFQSYTFDASTQLNFCVLATLDKNSNDDHDDPVTVEESVTEEKENMDTEESTTTISNLIAYTADELMKLKTVGLSKKWPSYLDEAFKNNRGTWDPDRWHQNKRRGSTPPMTEESGKPGREKNTDDKHKKDDGMDGVNKKKDIKDRLFMTETEGIVLSPQRRSFTTGCQVSKEPPKEAHAENGGPPGPKFNSSERESSTSSSLRGSDSISGSSRRVGSGRIRPSANMPPAAEDYDGGPPPPGRYNRNNYNDSSESRYGFNDVRDRNWNDHHHDKGGPSSRDRGGRNNGRGKDPREDPRMNRQRRNRDAEPEWMSEPVEQGDMMELRGFDQPASKPTKGN